jgi:hypothetical protein
LNKKPSFAATNGEQPATYLPLGTLARKRNRVIMAALSKPSSSSRSTSRQADTAALQSAGSTILSGPSEEQYRELLDTCTDAALPVRHGRAASANRAAAHFLSGSGPTRSLVVHWLNCCP